MFKRLFCKHDYKHLRNIHGDEIIARNWKRSEWKCAKCGKTKLENELHYEIDELPTRLEGSE